LIDIGII